MVVNSSVYSLLFLWINNGFFSPQYLIHEMIVSDFSDFWLFSHKLLKRTSQSDKYWNINEPAPLGFLKHHSRARLQMNYIKCNCEFDVFYLNLILISASGCCEIGVLPMVTDQVELRSNRQIIDRWIKPWVSSVLPPETHRLWLWSDTEPYVEPRGIPLRLTFSRPLLWTWKTLLFVPPEHETKG